jgi:hypothetical protein
VTVVDVWVNALTGKAAALDLPLSDAAVQAYLGGTATRLLLLE